MKWLVIGAGNVLNCSQRKMYDDEYIYRSSGFGIHFKENVDTVCPHDGMVVIYELWLWIRSKLSIEVYMSKHLRSCTEIDKIMRTSAGHTFTQRVFSAWVQSRCQERLYLHNIVIKFSSVNSLSEVVYLHGSPWPCLLGKFDENFDGGESGFVATVALPIVSIGCACIYYLVTRLFTGASQPLTPLLAASF